MASHKVGGLALSILGVRVVHQPIGLHMPPMAPRCEVEGTLCPFRDTLLPFNQRADRQLSGPPSSSGPWSSWAGEFYPFTLIAFVCSF